MKVLVCGSRHYDKPKHVARELTKLHAARPIELLIQGGATGADYHAKRWAQREKVPVCEFPANWQFEGKAGGPRRNAAMLRFGSPDVVVAFPGLTGTENMIAHARAAGVDVIEIEEP